jgi:purine nucleosidase
VEIRAIIGSHLTKGDGFDATTSQSAHAVEKARALISVMGLTDRHPLYRGAEQALSTSQPKPPSEATDVIIAEAMRADAETPLYYCAGAGLTELALAWRKEPKIGKKITLVWIGGPEYAGQITPPSGSRGPEYNLNIDIEAAQIIFGESDIMIWQVPRNAYRQALMSYAEILAEVQPMGKLGAHLAEAIKGVMELAAKFKIYTGETYIMGDSPLVTLTALQSSFEADPSSSAYITRPAPRLDNKGAYIDRPDGRPIRVYSQIDMRLTFSDFFAKLKLAAKPVSGIEKGDLGGRLDHTLFDLPSALQP